MELIEIFIINLKFFVQNWDFFPFVFNNSKKN